MEFRGQRWKSSWGQRWKSKVKDGNLRTKWKSEVKDGNLRSKMDFRGQRWKSECKDGKLRSKIEIWGQRWKSKVKDGNQEQKLTYGSSRKLFLPSTHRLRNERWTPPSWVSCMINHCPLTCGECNVKHRKEGLLLDNWLSTGSLTSVNCPDLPGII
jgi:hypothetical protein